MRAERQNTGPYGRVVVDTNVLLSAALSPHGVPAAFVDKVLAVGKLVFSNATFAELETRIWLPKFDRYLPMERRRSVLDDASAGAVWVDVPTAIAQSAYSRDPMDDVFIHTALAARASRLISGDNDLLCLNPLDSLQILSPRAGLDELERITSRSP
jgi:putative PIN family toxin of toxin-antitoxin system